MSSSSKLSEAGRRNLAEALDIQIRLLKDEMFKIDRQEEEYRLRKELVSLEGTSFNFQPLESDGRQSGSAVSSGLRDTLRSPEADHQAAAGASLSELENCLISVKEEEEEERTRGRMVGEDPATFEDELATLEGMDIAPDHKIDLGKVAR